MGRTRRTAILALLAAAALTLQPPPAGAGTATHNLNITATVATNCTLTAHPLAFGIYDPLTFNATTPLDASTTIDLNCSYTTAAVVAMDQGLTKAGGSTATVPLRQMASGANRLRYDIYQDAGRTTAWGTGGATDVNYTGTGLADTMSVYGRIGAGQSKPFGSYTDTVVITITF